MFVQLSLDEERFTEVFFLDASDQISLEAGFKSIAQAKGVGESFEDGLFYLEKRSDHWLLFLDNADDPKLDPGQYIHRRHGNVLITTRNPHNGDLAPDFQRQIDHLGQADATELLLRGVYLPDSVDRVAHAAEIVEVLGFFALVVNQARAFLAKGIAHYPITCDFTRAIPTQTPSTDSYKYTVYTIWSISFDCLSKTAKTFLQITCFMHHQSIPLFMFNYAHESLSELGTDDCGSSVPISLTDFLSTFTTEESTWNEFCYLQLIGEVRSFSLVEYDSLSQIISFHPLVQQWARHYSSATSSVIDTT
ncbi:hypothetical protein DL96DRAFT_1523473 [Flagelloscypha sp. PMI_526]|nr:hypothetical protein DL96DRAFT_1523473 [Flagelloscypha sp. PMI_526]